MKDHLEGPKIRLDCLMCAECVQICLWFAAFLFSGFFIRDAPPVITDVFEQVLFEEPAHVLYAQDAHCLKCAELRHIKNRQGQILALAFG